MFSGSSEGPSEGMPTAYNCRSHKNMSTNGHICVRNGHQHTCPASHSLTNHNLSQLNITMQDSSPPTPHTPSEMCAPRYHEGKKNLQINTAFSNGSQPRVMSTLLPQPTFGWGADAGRLRVPLSTTIPSSKSGLTSPFSPTYTNATYATSAEHSLLTTPTVSNSRMHSPYVSATPAIEHMQSFLSPFGSPLRSPSDVHQSAAVLGRGASITLSELQARGGTQHIASSLNSGITIRKSYADLRESQDKNENSTFVHEMPQTKSGMHPTFTTGFSSNLASPCSTTVPEASLAHHQDGDHAEHLLSNPQGTVYNGEGCTNRVNALVAFSKELMHVFRILDVADRCCVGQQLRGDVINHFKDIHMIPAEDILISFEMTDAMQLQVTFDLPENIDSQRRTNIFIRAKTPIRPDMMVEELHALHEQLLKKRKKSLE